jgi:RNA polymerase sigma factor (sigma-70 family)
MSPPNAYAEEFDSFVAEHRATLFSVALRACRGCPDPRQEALDRIQETLLKVWLNWETARRTKPLAYVITALQRECIDAYRRQEAGRRPPESLRDPQDLTLMSDRQQRGSGPGERDEQLSIRQQLRPILRRLRPSHREVLGHRFLLDQSVETVAQEFGVRPGTIKRSTSDAREAARSIQNQEERR